MDFASFSTVSGYGSRAPLRGPGMTRAFPLPLVGRARVGVLAPDLHRLSLTPPPPPPPHKKSGVPDLRKRKPISGKPEMGGEESRSRCTGEKRSAVSAHVLTLFLTVHPSLAIGGSVLFP